MVNRSGLARIVPVLLLDASSVTTVIVASRLRPTATLRASAIAAVATWAGAAASIGVVALGGDRRAAAWRCFAGGFFHAVACLAAGSLAGDRASRRLSLASAGTGMALTAAYVRLLTRPHGIPRSRRARVQPGASAA